MGGAEHWSQPIFGSVLQAGTRGQRMVSSSASPGYSAALGGGEGAGSPPQDLTSLASFQSLGYLDDGIFRGPENKIK